MLVLKFTPRRQVLLAVIALSAVAVVLTVYRQRPVQPEYITVPARLGDIENVVLATGRLDAIERINVGAQVSGEVKSLKVKSGDRVTKGQPVAEIDDLQQRNDLRAAETALEVVKANLMAKTITIEGTVEGDLIGQERIEIKASSNVKGNLIAARVTLEDGAKFRGSIDMDSQKSGDTGKYSYTTSEKTD